jgi:guanylate kinase
MKLILVGKAAAGKDFFRLRLEDKGFVSGISHTTRTPRKTETDGVDYHYIEEKEFIELIDSGEMLEHMVFNGTYYGLTREEFERGDVLIMSPEGLDLLPEDIKKRCLIIYLDISPTTRLVRLVLRDDKNDTLDRRFKADEKQFEDFKEFDLRVTNSEF